MGKAFPLLLIICFICINPFCHAQTSVKVSDPRIELQGSTIHIYYDFLNTDLSDKFDVSIDITDENGKKINAKALDGDIGEGVESGNNKHITWNLELDKIFLNAQIFFEINATLVPKPQATITQQQETTTQETVLEESPIQEAIEEDSPTQESSRKESPKVESPKEDLSGREMPSSAGSKEYDRTVLILQSLVIPGLGISRLTGEPHWIRGAAGYGCISGSIILNQLAIKTYNSVEDSPDFEDKQNLYNTSIRQDNISEVLAYAAVGIWVTDIVWTILGTSDLNNKSLARNIGGVSLGSNLDPLTFTPMVKIRYTF